LEKVTGGSWYLVHVDARFHVDMLPVYDSSDPTCYLRTGSYV